MRLPRVDLQIDVLQDFLLAQFHLEIFNEEHLCLLCKVFTS